MRPNLLPVARKPVNERIAEAYDEFVKRLGVERAQREVARRMYNDAGRWRDISRYMKSGAPVPRLPAAVQLAIVLEQPVDAFIDDPLLAISQELSEANQRAESIDHRLQRLEATVKGLPTAEDLRHGLETVTAAIQSVARADNPGDPPAQDAAK